MDIFVQQLRKAMFLKGWRQVDLKRAIGESDGQISSWYNGRYRPNAEKMEQIAKALGVSVAYLLGKEETPVAKLTLPQFHEIPVFREVAAGVPISAQEDIVGTITTDKEAFALKVKGDSMSPRIMDGDVVLVKSQSFAEDGDVVIAEIDGEITCKVFKKNHDSVTLVPFNPVFTPLVFSRSDNLHILGKVVESRHEW